MITDRSNALVLQKIHRLFHAIDGGRINDDVAVRIIAQDFEQQRQLLDAVALAHQITQIGTVKAGNVFIRLAQMELRQYVRANMTRRASRKGSNRTVGKSLAQAAELAVFGTEFVSPLRNAVGFVNGKKCDGHLLQPSQGIGAGKALGREIE